MGFSGCDAQASHCSGFSWCKAQALECTGLSSCGAWLSCPAACWILVTRPGIKPVSLALEGGFITTGPAGKSLSLTLKKKKKKKNEGRIKETDKEANTQNGCRELFKVLTMNDNQGSRNSVGWKSNLYENLYEDWPELGFDYDEGLGGRSRIILM